MVKHYGISQSVLALEFKVSKNGLGFRGGD
jgi:hypothetical protein